MLSTAGEYSDVFSRIDRWNQEVVSETLQRVDTRALRLSSQFELPTRPESVPAFDSISNFQPSSHSASSSECTSSPSEKWQTIDAITPDIAIDMNYLRLYEPAVNQLRLMNFDLKGRRYRQRYRNCRMHYMIHLLGSYRRHSKYVLSYPVLDLA